MGTSPSPADGPVPNRKGRELQVGDESHGCVKGCPHSEAPWALVPQPCQGLHLQLYRMELTCQGLCPKWGQDTAMGHSPAGFPKPLQPGKILPPVPQTI